MAGRGRPKQGNTAKNAPLNMRTSPDLRDRIEKAAEVNGRSLTQEVERRLITSFIFDDSRGGPHIGAFANMLCAVIQNVELDVGKKWNEDFEAFTMVRAATERLLEWRNPGLKDRQLRELLEVVTEKKAAEDLAATEFRALVERFGLKTVREGERPTDPVQELLWVSSGKPNLAALSDAERAEYDAARAADQHARDATSDAWEMVSIWRSMIHKQIEDIEKRGTSFAEGIFNEIGPREVRNGA